MNFVEVNLTELQDEGVLLAANERFFWPLGLALTWNHGDDGSASGLHVRQWVTEDGHIEDIGSDETDPIYADRRRRFEVWMHERVQKMSILVAARAGKVFRILQFIGATPR